MLSFIERIEYLNQQKAEIQQDIAEIKREAKGVGFDVKTINRIIKERQMTEEQRAEEEALLDIYKAAIGMLNDTPLGNAALDRLAGRRKSYEDPNAPYGEDEDNEDQPAYTEEPKPTEEQIEEARKRGTEAAEAGEDIKTNPYPAGSPLRHAWDNAYCGAIGSDGMDIPESFRRSKPAKKDEDKEGDDEQQ